MSSSLSSLSSASSACSSNSEVSCFGSHRPLFFCKTLCKEKRLPGAPQKYSILSVSDLFAVFANVLRLALLYPMKEIAASEPLARYHITAFAGLQCAQKICALVARDAINDAIAPQERQWRAFIASPNMTAIAFAIGQTTNAISSAAAAALCFERLSRAALAAKEKKPIAFLALPIHAFNGLTEVLDFFSDLTPGWLYGHEFMHCYENLLVTAEEKTYWDLLKKGFNSNYTRSAWRSLSGDTTCIHENPSDFVALSLYDRATDARLTTGLFTFYPTCLHNFAILLDPTNPPQNCLKAKRALTALIPSIRKEIAKRFAENKSKYEKECAREKEQIIDEIAKLKSSIKKNAGHQGEGEWVKRDTEKYNLAQLENRLAAFDLFTCVKKTCSKPFLSFFEAEQALCR